MEEELDLLVIEATEVAFFLGRVSPASSREAPFAARLRYTRTWVPRHHARLARVLAAHISPA